MKDECSKFGITTQAAGNKPRSLNFPAELTWSMFYLDNSIFPMVLLPSL